VFLRFVEIEGYRAAGRPLRVELLGRLSVIVGGNNSGKTTICDAIYQSFPNKFPSILRPIADTVHDNLGRINLTFEKSGDAPEDSLLGSGVTVDVKVGRKQGKATFVGDFRNALPGEALSKIMAIYLTADRQPVQELGRENSLLVVQLLRTVAADPAFDGDLGELYERAKRLLKLIVEDPLVVELEGRLRERMVSVSGGTANQIPHVGTSAMDQRLLARILELLLGEVSEETGRRLELSGLGYANLLYLAAILTALPRDESSDNGSSFDNSHSPDVNELSDEFGSLESSAGDKADGDIFPRETTLFVLLVEEPEAHLHPQLQAGVLQELRRLVKLLPTLQVILTTHSPEILAMSEPEELVVLPGRRFIQSEGCFALAAPVTLSRLGESIGRKNWEETRRMLRLHLDATRSGAVFADEVMLVEGPTDAVLFRRFGLAWAKDSADPKICASKARFVNALSIVAMVLKFPLG
jgi:putative ATP-dependent endonuclease of the OLD family